MLKREVQGEIQNWLKEGVDALLITGVRQIGKTYGIRHSLKEANIDFVEFNFIDQPELITLFENAKNAKDFIMRISVAAKSPLTPHKTILFFDEIQEFKDIMTRIKFLVEDGTFRYILSGSLLGVELHNLRSAPVGYVKIIDMYPMSFHEFIVNLGIQDTTITILKECFQKRIPVDDYVHEKMMDLFYLYQIIGGMPEAVDTYIRTNNIQKVSEVHERIIALYKQDFTKYEHRYSLKIKEIYETMASELDNKNKRFKMNAIKNGLSYERLENDFLWLKDAGVALPVYNIQEPKSPLRLSENRNLFKLFFSDVGLLTHHYSNITKMKILNKERDINNGALFENAIAQELYKQNFKVYYYNSKKYGELDFVIEYQGYVCPIEVKSGKSYKKHSALCNVLKDKSYDIKEAFVLSNYNVERDQKKTYLPIYMIMFFEQESLDNPIYKIDLRGL